MSAAVARPGRPTMGTARRPRRGLAALRGVQGFRRTVQVVIALLVTWVAAGRWASVEGAAGGGGMGGTASAESLCPFGGIESMWTFVATGGYVPHVHAANLVLAVAVVGLAFAARGAFCGWICPLGFLQDVVAGFGRVVQRRVPAVRRGVRTLQRRAAWLGVVDRPLRLLKYVVLGWAILGTAAFGIMVFRDVDPWIALIEVGRAGAGLGVVVLIVILLASLVVDRPWCRYACPLGAATGLVSRFSPVRLERLEAACTSCGVCTSACPMGLAVATATRITSADCTACLECVEACPRSGALELRVGLPVLRQA